MKWDSKSRLSASEKRQVLALVARTRARTGWTIDSILERLGLARSRYYDWQRRGAEPRLADGELKALCSWAMLPAEKRAVIDYALDHPKDGYRRLAWQMVDADVAYLSPSSVYRVLSAEDLLYRWKRSRSSGESPPEPSRPNERWHTDIMYLRVADTWYFLVTVLDAYSRYVVHWDLLSSMTAQDVRLVVQEAVEHSGAKPQIVSDNGSQFTSRDFKQLVRIFELEHIRVRTYHPESNGRVERFHRSTREALDGAELENLVRAREIIGRWVEHYNHERLHAALEYLPPAEYYEGMPEKRIAERKDKLEKARQQIHALTAWRRYNAATVIEQRIEELAQLGIGKTAIDDRDGNALLWALGALAYQLFHIVRRELFSGGWKRAQPRRIRLWFFRRAGKITTTARKHYLQLVRDHPTRHRLLAALRAAQALDPLAV